MLPYVEYFYFNSSLPFSDFLAVRWAPGLPSAQSGHDGNRKL